MSLHGPSEAVFIVSLVFSPFHGSVTSPAFPSLVTIHPITAAAYVVLALGCCFRNVYLGSQNAKNCRMCLGGGTTVLNLKKFTAAPHIV